MSRPKKRTDILSEIERIKETDQFIEGVAQYKADKYSIVYTGFRDRYAPDELSYRQISRDLDLITGRYDMKRAKIFRDNLINALQRNGASEAMVDFVLKNIKPEEIKQYPEEFHEIGTALTTFYKKDGYEDLLDNVATDLAEYVRRTKKRVLIPAQYGPDGEVIRRKWVNVDDLEALDGDAMRWGLEEK